MLGGSGKKPLHKIIGERFRASASASASAAAEASQEIGGHRRIFDEKAPTSKHVDGEMIKKFRRELPFPGK